MKLTKAVAGGATRNASGKPIQPHASIAFAGWRNTITGKPHKTVNSKIATAGATTPRTTMQASTSLARLVQFEFITSPSIGLDGTRESCSFRSKHSLPPVTPGQYHRLPLQLSTPRPPEVPYLRLCATRAVLVAEGGLGVGQRVNIHALSNTSGQQPRKMETARFR